MLVKAMAESQSEVSDVADDDDSVSDDQIFTQGSPSRLFSH